MLVPGVYAEEDAILKVMQDELHREYEVLKNNNPPAYYISYRIEDIENIYLEATLGIIDSDSFSHNRIASAQVRIGSPKIDSTHEIKGDEYDNYLYLDTEALPIENDLNLLKKQLWWLTYTEYKKALSRYQVVIADDSVMAKPEDQSDDYTLIEPIKDIKDVNFKSIDKNKWAEIVKKVSRIFRDYPDIYDSSVEMEMSKIIKYYVDSSGVILKSPSNYIRVYIYASTRSEDGMLLFLHNSYVGFNEEEIPSEDVLVKDAKDLAKKLMDLKKAPIIEPYNGPALFLPKAAAVFFHEVLGHRLEGHRQKSEEEGQTFTKKINQKILPSFISIIDDPAQQYFQGKPLVGFYYYDDEGVKAQAAKLVEDGVLKGFLMSRSPIKNFSVSNGHGRGEIGAYPTARQANLIVSAKETVPIDKLREMLIEECKKRKKPYGLIFADTSGGFTFTGRRYVQAFKVKPLEVYKVYTDGRPDELVRGVDIVGTPIAALEKIKAASDVYDVFNGFCGAESGYIPVSAVSPAILVDEIEIEKKAKDMITPPILPSPLLGDKK